MSNATALDYPQRRRGRKKPRSFTPVEALVNYVYRLYDNDGVAVYIGRSMDPLTRLKMHHASGAEWTKRVTGIDAWGPFRWADVLRLEREAITREKPIGNKEFVINKNYIPPVLP